MRFLVGTRSGLHAVRWVPGERSARIESKEFQGRDVTSIVPAGGTLFAIVRASGMHRSTDGGRSWTTAADRLDGHQVRTLAVCSRDPSRLYAGTEPPALHLSRDAGASWEELKQFRVLGVHEGWRDYGSGAAHVQTIACDPHDPRRVYAGVEIGGAYRSDDWGATWMPINEGLFDDIHQIVVDPRDGSRLFAATGGGLHVSRDRGAHWSAEPAELSERYCIQLAALSEATSRRSTLVLISADGPPGTWDAGRSGAGATLHVSRDAGETWVEFDTSGMGEKGAFTALAVDPVTPEAGFIGTSTGRIYYGNARVGRWSKILYGLPPIRCVQLL